jgi:histidine transporter
MTVVVMTGVLAVGVVLNAVIPEDVFTVIASIATFATVFVWAMILASHVAMKREIRRYALAPSEFPSPLWPAASVLAIAFMVFVTVLLGWFEDTRVALVVGGVWVALLAGAYALWVRGDGRRRPGLRDETAPLPVVSPDGDRVRA